MAWTTAGTLASGSAATLAVTNTTANDVRVVWTASNTAFPVVSAGGVTTWNIGHSYNGTSTSTFARLYWGLVTSTGAQTLSMTNTPFETLSQEFVPPAGTVSLDTSGHLSGTTSAVIAGVSLTPAGTGELWAGYSLDVGSSTAGNTTGVTYTNTASSDCIAWALNPGTGAFAPNYTQSGNWDTLAMFLLPGTGAAATPLRPRVVLQARNRAGTF